MNADDEYDDLSRLRAQTTPPAHPDQRPIVTAPMVRDMSKSSFPRVRRSNPFATARPGDEIADGIHLLGSERINFFAITEGRSVTLVDCGFYGHLRYLDAWLERTARRRTDIEAVVVTHAHADHLGFAQVLGAAGVPILVPAIELEVARTTKVRTPPVRLRRRLWRWSALRLLAEAAWDGVFGQPAVTSATGYAPDTRLDVPGRLRTIATPGHSIGSACLHLPRADALFTGDALMTRDPMGTARGPLVFAEHPARNAEAQAALARLAPFGHAALLPAHGEPSLAPDATTRALAVARIV